MKNDLFVGLGETGWDRAPWEAEPTFSPAELDVLFDWSISAIEAAERIGCVEHDVHRLRGMAGKGHLTPEVRRRLSA